MILLVKLSFQLKKFIILLLIIKLIHIGPGGLNVANCGEIGMQPYDSCRLIHHNYLNYVNLILENNYKELYRKFYVGMVTGDILVDLEIDSILEILSKVKNGTDEYALG